MKNKKAFTLVELMIVIAIIGLLVSMLTPMISSAMRKAVATNSKTFMSNMGMALTRYKDDNGDYPDFIKPSTRVNLDDADNAASLYKALTGKNPDGSRLSSEDSRRLNRRRSNYMDFNMNSIVNKNGKWKIVDGFGNPNIYICVAEGDDTHIKSGFPTRKDGIDSEVLREIVPNPSEGLRSKVILFTLKKDGERETADYSAEDIFSWY
ncbi:MAG: prepilin-type N-terminal cleavage/methylation domain-containing protein [Verrucomicrobiaceae bacterium]|nr:prepilin-type N-terminal cleavage/methylation domain-containing protein [Verrucomicrobiaceae bacterium]